MKEPGRQAHQPVCSSPGTTESGGPVSPAQDPATPVGAVTEAWPRTEPYGDDPDTVRDCCAFEGHQPWATTGDKFHGVVQTCACGDRLYDLTDTEIPK